MPNKRKDGKKRIAVWLTKQQRDLLNEIVSSGGAKDMSDFVIKAIMAEREKKGQKDNEG